MKDCLALILLCFVLFGAFLGGRPFSHPDEGRYVEIPREMVETGDYVTPRLNGVKYFEKPPLLYWLQAGAVKLFGLSEWAMRFVTLCLATLGVVMTYLFTQRFMGDRVAWWSALTLATAPLYFSLAHLILLDMLLTVCVMGALYSFYIAMDTSSRQLRRWWFYSFAGACACGVLAKGVVALAIPGIIIVAWLTLTQQWGRLRPFYPVTASVLFFAIAAPWHVLVSLKNPEFAHKYFHVEHFVRYTTQYHGRYQPLWFFVPVLILGFLPWIGWIRPAWRESLLPSPLRLYLGLWALWVFGFYSASNSKLIPYVLPAFAPLAIILGAFIAKMSPVLRRNLLCGLLALDAVIVLAAPYFQKPSMKPLVMDIDIPRQDRLVSYQAYFQDLPVYARRTVTVVDAKGELAFGTEVEDTSSWMIDKSAFLRMWQEEEAHVWTVMKQSDYADFCRSYPQLSISIVRQTQAHVLVINIRDYKGVS